MLLAAGATAHTKRIAKAQIVAAARVASLPVPALGAAGFAAPPPNRLNRVSLIISDRTEAVTRAVVEVLLSRTTVGTPDGGTSGGTAFQGGCP